MKQIRSSVFETNSSSIHAICINMNEAISYPKSIHFGFGEFGWGYDVYTDTSERADYLWTALTSLYEGEKLDELKNKIITWFNEDNIEYKFDESDYNRHRMGYVDHSEELVDFLTWIFADKNNLYQYLFTDKSFIETGNDNSEDDIPSQYKEYKSNKDYTVFIK